MYLRAIKDEYQEELEQVREEDKPVLEAIEKANQEAEEYKMMTQWHDMPYCVRLVLLLGSFSVCVMIHIFMEHTCPAPRCTQNTLPNWPPVCSDDDGSCPALKDFELTDNVCEKLGCNPLNVLL